MVRLEVDAIATKKGNFLSLDWTRTEILLFFVEIALDSSVGKEVIYLKIEQ